MKSIAARAVFAAASLAHAAHAAHAADAAWSIVDSPSFESSSIAIAVGFDAEGRVGYSGGGEPGCPAFIRKTSDGGTTWDRIWPQGNCTALDFNLFLSAAARDAEHAVVGGSFFQTYTEDGKAFHGAVNDFGSPPQDADVIPGSNMFALVSGKTTAAGGNTIQVSDSGVKYSGIAIPDSVVNSTNFLARYGAFPSESTWYVTAGSFDTATSSSPAGPASSELSKYVAIDRQGGSARMRIRDGGDGGDNGGNCAAIVKTTDGGKSWETVYKNRNTGDNIYPNGVHCSNEMHCVAVLEGDSARIIVTRDGGKTWNETMIDNDPHSSLFAVRMVSDTEVWAAGGHPSGQFEGRFWHSSDGGDTWKKTAFPNTYIVSLDMLSPELGYAVALTSGNPAGVKLFKYSA